IVDLHRPQRLLGPARRLRPALAGDLEHLRQLAADPDGGIEGTAGLLVHHGDRPGPQHAQRVRAQRPDILARHRDGPGAHPPVPREVADEGEGHGRLAAAGLADQPVGLLRPDLERDVPDRQPVHATHAVGHVDVRGVYHRPAGGQPAGRRRSVAGHWMTTASMESAMRLMATTSEAIASAGKSVCHQYPAARYWALL